MKKQDTQLRIKRAYDPAATEDGARYLVDRLWPRGVKKETLMLTGWLKDVAPSTELRKWFGHEVDRWDEFRRRYRAELKEQTEALKPLREALGEGVVTLVYSAHDEEHNQAVVLREWLLESHHSTRTAAHRKKPAPSK